MCVGLRLLALTVTPALLPASVPGRTSPRKKVGPQVGVVSGSQGALASLAHQNPLVGDPTQLPSAGPLLLVPTGPSWYLPLPHFGSGQQALRLSQTLDLSCHSEFRES